MKQAKVTIYTEFLNIGGVEDILSKYFNGFTLLSGSGYYDQIKEPSLIIEYIGSVEYIEDVLTKICREIKKLNNQKVILTTLQDVNFKLI